ncbi:MAG TPA: DUF2235 domain-containing protein, partial [Opitutus sp.]|nr:DUF2235 domain-containing protein [Opitutus sp.]
MSKLVVCCDGTWNTPDQEEYELPAPTNVLRLYNALALSDGFSPQYKYYHPGVGTEGSFLKRTAGGMYGAGLAENVQSAYAWLARHYKAGDKIYLFGFSRGAFTVRCLGGMLSRCGILDLRNAVDPFPDEVPSALPVGEAWKRVGTAYEKGYRERKDDWRDASWELSAPPGVAIELIGVWDTVGALGIPNDLALLNLLDRPKAWSFHDTTLGQNVHYARHAIAMDEMRASFTPTLWTDTTGRPLHDRSPAADGGPARVRQVFFPGVHSDVGGGYYERGLAEGALQWMIEESAALPGGLVFEPKSTAQLAPDVRAPLHNSLRGIFKLLKTRPRNLPAFSDEDRYSATALSRLKDPPLAQSPYFAPARIVPPGQPPNSPIPPSNVPADRILKRAGASTRCNIYAVNPWN